jgi:Dolichyl-phosphate-mannose-protein mannosyltransferase
LSSRNQAQRARESPGHWAGVAGRAIVGGTAVRVVYGLVLHPPADHVSGDMAGYVQRAVHLAGGGRVPRVDYFMPPGTQLLISLPMRVFGTGRAGLWAASVLWCALSCCYPWLAWKWAGRFLSPRAAALTAIGCAVSPLAIIYGGYFSSELPALVLLPAGLWLVEGCVDRARTGHSESGSPRVNTNVALAVVAGATVVLVLVVRQQFALNLAISAAPLAGLVGRPAGRAVAAALSAGVVAALAVIVLTGAPPWRVQGGLPPLFGQNGGVNFFYGHCDARVMTAADLHFENPVRAQLHTGTDITVRTRRAGDQGYFYRKGVDCIGKRPLRAGVIALRSVADMTATSIPFPPWTESGLILVVAEAANAAYCVVLVLLVLAALGRVGRDAVPRYLLLQLACAFAAAVAFLGEPRYRVPYDLFGFALAGWWLARRDDAVGPV